MRPSKVGRQDSVKAGRFFSARPFCYLSCFLEPPPEVLFSIARESKTPRSGGGVKGGCRRWGREIEDGAASNM